MFQSAAIKCFNGRKLLRYLTYRNMLLDSEFIRDFHPVAAFRYVAVHHLSTDDLKFNPVEVKSGVQVQFRVSVDLVQDSLSEQSPPLVQQGLVGQSLRRSVAASVVSAHTSANIALYA